MAVAELRIGSTGVADDSCLQKLTANTLVRSILLLTGTVTRGNNAIWEEERPEIGLEELTPVS